MPPLRIQLPPEISRNELALHGMADFGDLERPLPRTDIGMQRLRAWGEGMHEHWFLPKGGIDFEVAVDKKLWPRVTFMTTSRASSIIVTMATYTRYSLRLMRWL